MLAFDGIDAADENDRPQFQALRLQTMMKWRA
jgi:hypothetical protein